VRRNSDLSDSASVKTVHLTIVLYTRFYRYAIQSEVQPMTVEQAKAD